MSYETVFLTDATRGLLSRIAPEVFDHAIAPEQLQRFLDDPRHLMLLATDGDTVVGMASAFEYFHPDKVPQLFVNEVGVTPSHRRRGIGRALVQSLLDEAKRRGCTGAWLGTGQDNLAGQACFGSVPDGEAPQPFLLYEWDLTDPDPMVD